MNIIEAIKSGKPFTRKDWDDPISGWCHVDDVEGIPTVVFMTGKDRSFIGHVDDLLADDWEIQEPTVTITRTEIELAWRTCLNLHGVVTIKHLADVLGLEGP